MFRVSPNELSFASVKSWKAIYGPWPGEQPFVKTEFYDMYGSGFESRCIGSERDPTQHNRMKRSLAGGFSSKALLEQETLVQRCVDKFIEKVGQAGKGTEGLNITEWYEMIAFDVLGEMAFGESFHCIDDGTLSFILERDRVVLINFNPEGKPHFWQQMTVKHLFFITLLDNLRRYPLLRRLGQLVIPRLTVAVRDKHTGYSRQQVAKSAPRFQLIKNLKAN